MSSENLTRTEARRRAAFLTTDSVSYTHLTLPTKA